MRQLVPTLAGIPYQQNWYDAIGYTTRVVPTSDPGLKLIVADPTGRARCPKPGPPPPVT